MRILLHISLIVCSAVSSLAAFGQPANDKPKQEAAAPQSQATIEGLVRDIACPIQNAEATATHLSMTCLRACVRRGSPLVILTKNGELYVPISDKMPDKDQRQKLMPFLGKYVRVTGAVYERKGTHAITIKEIVELKDVHLNIED
jgi:hypothetical protein